MGGECPDCRKRDCPKAQSHELMCLGKAREAHRTSNLLKDIRKEDQQRWANVTWNRKRKGDK